MIYKILMRTLVLTVVGSAFALPAVAQWQWVDKDGKKVFSDRAPPADVLQKNILKQPGLKPTSPAISVTPLEAASVSAKVASSPAQNSSAPKLLKKDSELESRKKQTADLEKVQKQAESDKLAAAKADNCERVRKGQASLLSGVRIAVVNAKGEREVMDDNARLLETRRLQTIVDSDCPK